MVEILITGQILGIASSSAAETDTSSGLRQEEAAGQSASSRKALSSKLVDGRQRAFPSAEGFGAAAKGGRSGRIIFVTNTNDSGEGSLRACVDTSGARNCIFRVAGTIELRSGPLIIRNGFITIAGETAPGGGVAIRNGPSQLRPSIEVRANDVIIRHLRLRPGPHTMFSCCSGALGLYTTSATNVMLDHLSASWGSDETVDSEDATNFTFQWGIVSEPLYNGGPGKHRRARNMYFTKGGNISVHHSLFAMGLFRNPQIRTKIPNTVAEVVNNVLYSPQWQYVVSFGDKWSHINANVIANYKIAGENLINDRIVQLFEESGKGFSVFAQGNFDENYSMEQNSNDKVVFSPEQIKYFVPAPFAGGGIESTSPHEAIREVLQFAGATKPQRDAVDRRVVKAVRSRTGKILDHSPEEVGGWPNLESSEPYTDKDKDGMADTWELTHKLDPTNTMDGLADDDGDGWTNFEEFLHELAGDPT